MTPDGRFRAPPARPRGSPLATKIAVWALIVAVIAAAGTVAALAAWLVFLLIPVVLIAGAVAYLSFRFQIWRARGSGSRQRDLFRP